MRRVYILERDKHGWFLVCNKTSWPARVALRVPIKWGLVVQSARIGNDFDSFYRIESMRGFEARAEAQHESR